MSIVDGNGMEVENPSRRDGRFFSSGLQGDREVTSFGLFIATTSRGKPQYWWASLRFAEATTHKTAPQDVINKAVKESGSVTISRLARLPRGELERLGIFGISRARISGKRVHVHLGSEESRDESDFVVDCAKANPVKSSRFLRVLELALRDPDGMWGVSHETVDALGEDHGAIAKGRASDDSVTLFQGSCHKD